MSRYFFSVRGGPLEAEDELGGELPDLQAVRREALIGARSIIAAEVLEGRLTLSERIEVDDGEGHRVHTLAFADAIGPPT